MEVAQARLEPPSLLPSPTSHSSSSSSSTTTNPTPSGPPTPTGHSPRPVTRSEPANPYPTTFVQADTSSFKQVVQMLTGSPKPDSAPPQPAKHSHHHHHHHSIPPIKTLPKKSGSGSGFKLYERRNSLKSLRINPLAAAFHPGSGASPRNPEILSPSILDFPALVLSPVTPLTHDPFARSPRPGVAESPGLDPVAEEKAIREKGFFLHPSPATTPRDPEPRLLPLFPLSSPRLSGSSSSN